MFILRFKTFYFCPFVVLPFAASCSSCPASSRAQCEAAHFPGCRGQKLEVKPVKRDPVEASATHPPSCLQGAFVKMPHECFMSASPGRTFTAATQSRNEGEPAGMRMHQNASDITAADREARVAKRRRDAQGAAGAKDDWQINGFYQCCFNLRALHDNGDLPHQHN